MLSSSELKLKIKKERAGSLLCNKVGNNYDNLKIKTLIKVWFPERESYYSQLRTDKISFMEITEKPKEILKELSDISTMLPKKAHRQCSCCIESLKTRLIPSHSSPEICLK